MARKVIVYDKQAITRIGITTLIKQVCSSADVLFADSKETLVKLLETSPNSLVVLDYTLSDLNSADGLLNISARFGNTDWLLFSEELNVQFIKRVIVGNPSFSVVLKNAEQKELESGVSSAYNSDSFICSQVTNLLTMANETEVSTQNLLTITEQEILKEIALGKTTKEIAMVRNTSYHTITTHRKNIFRKLNVNNAQEASRYALRSGILDASDYYI